MWVGNVGVICKYTLLNFRVYAYWVKGRVLIEHEKGYGWLLYRKFGIT